MHSAKSNESVSSKQQQQTATVYREIPQTAGPSPAAGEVGQAAVTAAAMHQLDRYAEDIEQYVNASNLRLLLNKIQGDLRKDEPGTGPKMRLRRE